MFPRDVRREPVEQLGGIFGDMPSDFERLSDDFERLREDCWTSFGSLSDAASSQEDPDWPEKSFLEFTDLVAFAVASVASCRAAGAFAAWAGSLQLNGLYRVKDLHEDERMFHSDRVASIARLAAASVASWRVANILAKRMCM